jgi:hypothetical protein
MARKSSASKRLALAIKASEPFKPYQELPLSIAPAPRRGEASAFPIDLQAPLAKPVRKAFAAFHLDHANANDWAVLVVNLAYVQFGESRKRGRSSIWTAKKLCQLAARYAEAKSQDPKKFDTDICKSLCKKGRPYAQMTWKRLRRVLQDAFSPMRNAALGRYLLKTQIETLAAQRAAAKETGRAWTEVDEDCERKRLFKEIRTNPDPDFWLKLSEF